MPKFPFITRSHHEEVVAELRSQRDRAEEEKRRVLDLFTFRATGEKLFYPDPTPEAIQRPKPTDETPMGRVKRELGHRASDPRAIVAKLERDNEEEFVQSRSTAFPSDADELMKAKLQEGRAAAQKA